MATTFEGIYDGARALGLPVDHHMSGFWFTIPKEDSAALHALSDPPEGYYDDQGEDPQARKELEKEYTRLRKDYRRALSAMVKAAQAAVLSVLPEDVLPGGLSIIHTHGSEDPLTPHYHVIVLIAPVAFEKASGRCRTLRRWRSEDDLDTLRLEWTKRFNRVMHKACKRYSTGEMLNVHVEYKGSQGRARHTINYEPRAPLKDLMDGMIRPGVYRWRDKAKKRHERTVDVAEARRFLLEFQDRRCGLNRYRQWGFLAPRAKGKRLPALGFQRVEDGDQGEAGDWVALGTFALNWADLERGVAIMRQFARSIEVPLAAFFVDDPVGVSAGHSLWQRIPDG